MSIFDPNNSNSNTVETTYRQETRATLTRSQSAEAIRTIEGMKNTYVNLRPVLINKMMNVDTSDLTSFAELQEDIKVLDGIKESIEAFERIVSDAPVETPRNSTAQEQSEIQGLYKTGRYREEDLAKQYSLTQGGVNKILNRDND